MRVLVAQIPMPGNRFLKDLNDELGAAVELVHSSEMFWNREGRFDVVHLHFPEYLTFELQDAYKKGLGEELIRATEERLAYWASRAKLVVTRHVLLPHDALSDPLWERMYAVFYRYASGVVHFARASVEEFKERYRGLDWFSGTEPAHAIVPHQNYASLPNEVTKEAARQKLGIPPNAAVMAVFGAIRNDAERDLILESFHRMSVGRKLLLVSRWREKLATVSWIRLKYWIRDLVRLYYRVHPRYRFNYTFVEEEEAQYYMNAADVLFIPRFRVLNSGNVTMGMTFGRIVVGPDSWDVGELLRETGNPVFDPDRPETAAAALEEGFRLAAEGTLAVENQQRAVREWGIATCAAMYIVFYREVTGVRPEQEIPSSNPS